MLYVTADSALQFLGRSFGTQSMSAPLLKFAHDFVRPGHVVWDIGANVGVFSFASAFAAGAAGEVLAVEPDFMLAWLLQRSAERNRAQLPNVRVLCAAVSDRAAFSRLEIAARGRASNSLTEVRMRSQGGGIRYSQDVLTTTLDTLLEQFRKPDIVKIDVEGAESLVIKGGTKLLSEVRPVIYIEVGDEQAAAIAHSLSAHKYLMFDGEANGYPQVGKCVFNTLAVPHEHSLSPSLSKAGT